MTKIKINKDWKIGPIPEREKWLNTKWDVRNWTKEQKRAFQEECFKLGYGYEGNKVKYLNATAYNIFGDGVIGFWLNNPMCNFKEPQFGIEKKWEDMFPTNSTTEVENLNQDTSDHECWMHYNHTMDCCLKCHPEKDLRQQQIWGILDTARREREYIEEVKRGK